MWRRKKGRQIDMWNQTAMGTGHRVRKAMYKGHENIKVKKDYVMLRQEEKKKGVKTEDVKKEWCVFAGKPQRIGKSDKRSRK